MFQIFCIICGIGTTSILCPIVYFVLDRNKGFQFVDSSKVKSSFSDWMFWGCMFAAFCLSTGFIFGFNMAFKIGCIIGLLCSFLGWIYFLFFTAKGAAVRVYLDIHTLKKQLKLMKKNEFNRSEIEALKAEIELAERKANDLVVSKSRNRINKILNKYR